MLQAFKPINAMQGNALHGVKSEDIAYGHLVLIPQSLQARLVLFNQLSSQDVVGHDMSRLS